MVIKRSVLTFFATLASLSVVANNLVPVSAPTLADALSEIEPQHASVVQYQNAPPVSVLSAVVQTSTAGPAVAAPVLAVAAAPVAETSQEVTAVQLPVAAVESESVIIPERIATDLASVKPAAESVSFLVSEWIDVPREVLQRLRLLPAPASPVSGTEITKATAKPQPLIVRTVARVSSAIFGRSLLPLPAEPVLSETLTATTKPEIESPVSEISSAIVERANLPLPAAPAISEPLAAVEPLRTIVSEPKIVKPTVELQPVIKAVFSRISYEIVGRLQMPIPEAPVIQETLPVAEPPIATLAEIEKPNSEVSAAIVERNLLPVPAAPVVVETMTATADKPVTVVEAIHLVETETVKHLVNPVPIIKTVGLQVASAIFTRRLLPLPTVPVAVETLPAVTQQEVAVIETPRPTVAEKEIAVSTSEVSSAIVERSLLPVPAAPLAEVVPNVRAEEHVAVMETVPAAVAEPEAAKPAVRSLPIIESVWSTVSTAIFGRSQLPIPAAPVVQETVTAPAAQQVALSESSPITVAEPETAQPAVKSLPLIDSVLSSVSSAIFGRRLLPIPAAPVAPEPPATVAAVENKPAVTTEKLTPAIAQPIPAAKPAPVLISQQTAYSTAMLTPLDTEPQRATPLFPDTVSMNKGPTIEASIAKDEYANLMAAEKAKRAAAPLPVLISANSGFSADMLKPMSTSPVFPPNPFSVLSVQSQQGSYCDPKFEGLPIRFYQTLELKLDDLLNQLSNRFGVNFIVGPEIGKLPLNVKAGNVPWAVLLRSQLYVSGIKAKCINANTVELVLNDKVANLEKAQIDAEVLQSKYIKLKYLQPSSSGNKNIAGQSSGGGGSSGGGQGGQCQPQGGQGGGGGGGQGGGQAIPQRCKFERLMSEIRQILGLNDQRAPAESEAVRRQTATGDVTSVTYSQAEISKRPYVGQVPGRNMLLVNASASQLRDIDELIRHADVPPFQVVIRGLVYTANEDKLKDIGVKASAIVGTGNLNSLGGVTSQPGPVPTPVALLNPPPPPGSLQPGSIRTLGTGFGQPSGSGDGIFGFSTIIGTAQFSVQATALQRDGVIAIKSRPFATVLDGDTTDLTVGRQVPVLIQAVNPIGGAPGTLVILQAANLLSVTPHVIDDENGNPTAVNLELQLESNELDTAFTGQGVPPVSVRSIQTNFILNQEQTVILGGFTVDSDSKTVTKTPGLGDIPILGELFKRRVRSTQVNRLYFAISVTVIPYGGLIEPVKVPGATTDPPTITEEMLKRAKSIEPKPLPVPSPTPRIK